MNIDNEQLLAPNSGEIFDLYSMHVAIADPSSIMHGSSAKIYNGNVPRESG